MRRSFWVTFFSLSFIVFALYWIEFAMVIILGTQFPLHVSDAIAIYLILLAFFYVFAGISAAIRKAWGAKLIVALSVTGILTIGLAAPFLHEGISAEAGISKDGKYYRLREQKVKETSSFPEGVGQAVTIALGEGLERMGIIIGNVLLGAIETAVVLYLIIILTIFRRDLRGH